VNQNTILLIDDDGDLLQAVGDRCRNAGYRVEQARNLLTAAAMIDKHKPDVICIDVHMPTGCGLDFCEMLVRDPKTADLPIIVLTGQRDGETLRMCRWLQLEYAAKQNDAWRILEPLIQKLITQGRQKRTIADTGLRPHPLPAGQIPPFQIEADRDGAPRAGGKQIVVADDDAELVRVLSQRFSSLGCSVIGSNSAVEAINAIHRIIPDLVCLDVNMPNGNGLSICEMMAADARLRSIPVIILTGCSDQTTIRRCHDMLVFYVLKGTDVWSRIQPLVRELLHLEEPVQPKPQIAAEKQVPKQKVQAASAPVDRDLIDAVFAMLNAEADAKSGAVMTATDPAAANRKPDPPWVLCIDDDKDYSETIKTRLEQYGVAVARAFNGIEGYRMVFTHPASAILLDYNLPNGQGDYILDRLKRSPVTKDIPVFVITGVRDKVLERRMLAMGAAAFLTKPVTFSVLRQHLARYMDILATPEETLVAQ
jgi:CheY-like chemotaxis protein